MGIKGLFPFLAEHAPLSIKHTKLEAMTSRTIAIDASMCLHQFLVAVRQGDAQVNLSNEAGEVTSHIQGFLNRTLKLLESGLRPIYVFDGSPPELKRGTLAARAEQKAAAEAEYSAALRAGDANDIRKASHRISRATPQMNEDVQELLRIIGCPVILAPSEAEASCAALCKAGVAWATATEDMDALTFGTPRMLKNLFDTESARSGTKKPVYEISLPAALEQLDLSMESFVDFCVLCGCDYCGTLRGVGPTTAFRLLKQHGTPAKVAEATAASKRPPEDSWKLPEDWRPDEARALFLKPEVIRTDGLKVEWGAPDLDALRAFLVERHSFNAARVEKAVERLRAIRSGGKQTRLEAFFSVKAPRPLAAGAKYDPFAKRPPISKAKANGRVSGYKRGGA